MLAKPDLLRHQIVRPSQSLRQAYEEFLQQRIEDYKNRLGRVELMALADAAVKHLDGGAGVQLALTEVLVAEQVDRLIVERLRIPVFSKWKNWFTKIRLAQRQATHWQRIEPDCSLIDLVLYLEPDDRVLVLGQGCADHGYYVAAHDCNVLFIAEDVSAAVSIEHRAASEALSSKFEARAVDLCGNWFPESNPTLVVLDPHTVCRLGQGAADSLIRLLQGRTVRGGKHYVPPLRQDAQQALELPMANLKKCTRDGGRRVRHMRVGCW